MIRLLLATAICLLPLCCSAERCETPLLPAIETFILRVGEISRQERLTRQQRWKRYETATERLLYKARELRIAPPDLSGLAQACIENEEAHRSPPPGWDPKDKVNNTVMFHRMAVRSVRIHLRLMSYGWKDCNPETTP
ncbi:MAG: hypothetical protein V1792_21980 [Pseudomonadota bacterium]